MKEYGILKDRLKKVAKDTLKKISGKPSSLDVPKVILIRSRHNKNQILARFYVRLSDKQVAKMESLSRSPKEQKELAFDIVNKRTLSQEFPTEVSVRLESPTGSLESISISSSSFDNIFYDNKNSRIVCDTSLQDLSTNCQQYTATLSANKKIVSTTSPRVLSSLIDFSIPTIKTENKDEAKEQLFSDLFLEENEQEITGYFFYNAEQSGATNISLCVRNITNKTSKYIDIKRHEEVYTRDGVVLYSFAMPMEYGEVDFSIKCEYYSSYDERVFTLVSSVSDAIMKIDALNPNKKVGIADIQYFFEVNEEVSKHLLVNKDGSFIKEFNRSSRLPGGKFLLEYRDFLKASKDIIMKNNFLKYSDNGKLISTKNNFSYEEKSIGTKVFGTKSIPNIFNKEHEIAEVIKVKEDTLTIQPSTKYDITISRASKDSSSKSSDPNISIDKINSVSAQVFPRDSYSGAVYVLEGFEVDFNSKIKLKRPKWARISENLLSGRYLCKAVLTNKTGGNSEEYFVVAT